MANQRTRESALPSLEKIPPVVLMLGPEEALASRAVDEYSQTIHTAVPDVEVTTVDARRYSKNDLLALTSSSLFADKKLLLMTHLEEATQAFQDDFLQYMQEPSEGVWVLATHRGGNRAPRVPRAVRQKKFGLVQCKTPTRDDDKIALVRDEVRRLNGSIDHIAAAGLVAALGSDLGELLGAASQLVFDSGGNITDADVHTFYKGRVETKPYEVGEALADQDGARALLLVRQAYATGVHPVVIVSTMATKFRALTKLKRPGVSAKDLKMQPWLVRKAQRQAARWDERSLGRAMVLLAAADAAVKGESRTPESAVELTIIKIAQLAGSRG